MLYLPTFSIKNQPENIGKYSHFSMDPAPAYDCISSAPSISIWKFRSTVQEENGRGPGTLGRRIFDRKKNPVHVGNPSDHLEVATYWLMEEIPNNQLGCINTLKNGDIYHINW